MKHLGVDQFIDAILTDRRFAENIVAERVVEPSAAEWTDFPPQSDPRVLQLFATLGIERLFSHQREAIDAALAGKNLVISTGVASGKSLCYQFPMLQQQLLMPQSRALLLFPTKALAQDQQQKMDGILNLLARQLPTPAKLNCGIYDGDTPADTRRKIRKEAQFLFSNPDMLHLAILPNHTLWTAFFASLRWIVIDEVHIYRGVFGSHFANVIRRIKRICELYGSKPQFICTSATLANAQQLAQDILESPVTHISTDGSPHGKRAFYILNPPMVNPELGIRRSALMETTAIAKRFLHTDGQAILFTGPRRSVEILYLYLMNENRFADRVRSYRSGYLAEMRRKIEAELREKRISLVVSTNALELGIDIGGLDAVFLNGYPGTISATRQQAGRAGRKGNTALCFMVAGANPLDQYICQHPEYIFDNNPEYALIDPDNGEILRQHLLCAVFDMALLDNEAFGSLQAEHIFPHLQLLVQDGKIKKAGKRYIGIPERYPAADVSLRNVSDRLQIFSGEELIGYIDRESAMWMTHPNAVYLDKGDTWMVKKMDLEHSCIEVEDIRVNYYTQTTRDTQIEMNALLNLSRDPRGDKYLGKVTVTTTITGFKKLRFFTSEILGYEPLDLPPTVLKTVAWWFSLTPQTVNAVRDQGLWRNDPNTYGKGWKALCATIRARDNYRCRNCGIPEAEKPHDVHHIIPFRRFDSPEEANAPANLSTLCPRCHRLAEANVLIQSGLAGLGYLIVNLAPFFVMCDRKDIDVFTEDKSPLGDDNPVVLIYDAIPGGIGLSRKLYDLHDRVLREALHLAERCPCESGCPACVGPVAENGSGAKEHAIAILKELCRQE
ncbi:MAG: DEAD/DEAH box helicase [Candidatus Cloacimonadaceae bacterium]|nr:DEAD/DEAH box helicase [Candidatus Cloacimonadaceae bacterium]